MNSYYPKVKLDEDDKGAGILRLHLHNSSIVIDFGKRFRWIALSTDEAMILANSLIELTKKLKETLQ